MGLEKESPVTETADKVLTLKGVEGYLLWRAQLQGRRESKIPGPVDDHRLIAGLLFERLNDGTTRVLLNSPGEEPRVQVTWSMGSAVAVPVVRSGVWKLLRKGYVEDTPESRSSNERLQLTRKGKRLIVTMWFRNAERDDRLKAGGIYHAA